MNVRQTAIGTNIDQSTHIYNRPLDLVDICADKIEALLDKISHIDFFIDNNSRLRPPDIETKNQLNGLGAADVYVVEGTYAVWDDITAAIRADASGRLANEYNKASYILNQLYLASFLKSFADLRFTSSAFTAKLTAGLLTKPFFLFICFTTCTSVARSGLSHDKNWTVFDPRELIDCSRRQNSTSFTKSKGREITSPAKAVLHKQ